jgi:LmbE family N-acetylglucosaminyl deacetylase
MSKLLRGKMNKQILIIAAHPDDEVLACGGTIARHVKEGDSAHVLFLGDGVSSRDSDPNLVNARKESAVKTCEILGAAIVSFEKFPDNMFDTVPLLDIVRVVESAKKEINPQIIYTHHGGDLNIDHRITCQAVLTAFRPQPGEEFSEIRAFEINSSTEWSSSAIMPPFIPDTFVDISQYLDKLLNAYSCYADEIREEPHARSLEALKIAALRRGREAGLQAAEAFMTLRRIFR